MLWNDKIMWMLCNNNSYANPYFRSSKLYDFCSSYNLIKLLIVSRLSYFTSHGFQPIILGTAPDLSLSWFCDCLYPGIYLTFLPVYSTWILLNHPRHNANNADHLPSCWTWEGNCEENWAIFGTGKWFSLCSLFLSNISG